MPVRKFRSIEEMKAVSKWLPAGDPAIGRRFRHLCAFVSALPPMGAPRGVRKYRSIEEAHADRERWEQSRIERIRADREKS